MATAAFPGLVVLLFAGGREALPGFGLGVFDNARDFCGGESALLLSGADVSGFARNGERVVGEVGEFPAAGWGSRSAGGSVDCDGGGSGDFCVDDYAAGAVRVRFVEVHQQSA